MLTTKKELGILLLTGGAAVFVLSLITVAFYSSVALCFLAAGGFATGAAGVIILYDELN